MHLEELRGMYMTDGRYKQWRNIRHDETLRNYRRANRTNPHVPPDGGGYAVITSVTHGRITEQSPVAQSPPFQVGEILVLENGLGSEVPQSGSVRTPSAWHPLVEYTWVGGMGEGDESAYAHALRLALGLAVTFQSACPLRSVHGQHLWERLDKLQASCPGMTQAELDEWAGKHPDLAAEAASTSPDAGSGDQVDAGGEAG